MTIIFLLVLLKHSAHKVEDNKLYNLKLLKALNRNPSLSNATLHSIDYMLKVPEVDAQRLQDDSDYKREVHQLYFDDEDIVTIKKTRSKSELYFKDCNRCLNTTCDCDVFAEAKYLNFVHNSSIRLKRIPNSDNFTITVFIWNTQVFRKVIKTTSLRFA
ncbi:hypothetical protein GJ496_008747 [Pomphorhynchus laevis]|nr:hypothetical protein GJ496_008747 [Pomphorhynchus laevis]